MNFICEAIFIVLITDVLMSEIIMIVVQLVTNVFLCKYMDC